jgi:hypothetical protein
LLEDVSDNGEDISQKLVLIIGYLHMGDELNPIGSFSHIFHQIDELRHCLLRILIYLSDLRAKSIESRYFFPIF